MATFKTIKTFQSLLGGYAYRVTSDGVTVKYQERSPRSDRFVTRATEGQVAFNRLADDARLFDSYEGDNPAVIARRISELVS